jgi:hypothetical protein
LANSSGGAAIDAAARAICSKPKISAQKENSTETCLGVIHLNIVLLREAIQKAELDLTERQFI